MKCFFFELAVGLKASYAVEKSAVGKCEKFVIADMIADKWSFFCPQSWLEGGCAMVHGIAEMLEQGEVLSVEFKRCGAVPEKDTFETVC